MGLQLEWFVGDLKKKIIAIKKLAATTTTTTTSSKVMVKRCYNNDTRVTTNTHNNNSSNSRALALVIIEIYNNLHVCVQDNWTMEFVVFYQDLMELTWHNTNSTRTRSYVGSCCAAPINVIVITWFFSHAKGAFHCS